MTKAGAAIVHDNPRSAPARLRARPAGAAAPPARHPVIGDTEDVRRIVTDWFSTTHDFVADRGQIASLIQAYGGSSDDVRMSLLAALATDFGPADERIRQAIDDYVGAAARGERRHAVTELRHAIASPLRGLLARFNAAPEGMKFLLELRADVLRFIHKEPDLAILDLELHALLAGWFDHGFLELQRISWSAPAALLEKLIGYEAVHEIRSWSDLRNRLDGDRRCYALFHPCLPGEPLVFVEVALVDELVLSIQALLDETAPTGDPRLARVAMFYSISNTQPGLRGVRFGGLLIDRVLESLRRELPQVRSFVTLSPAPLLRQWIQSDVSAVSDQLTSEERLALCTLAAKEDPHGALLALLEIADWRRRQEIEATLKPVLLRLAAHYLLAIKRSGLPCDPVARFHLENGARIDGIHWLADTSDRGLRQSAGMMVSYLYEPHRVNQNRQAYASTRTIKAAQRVKHLLRPLSHS